VGFRCPYLRVKSANAATTRAGPSGLPLEGQYAESVDDLRIVKLNEVHEREITGLSALVSFAVLATLFLSGRPGS
jgi:hypothetical protein